MREGKLPTLYETAHAFPCSNVAKCLIRWFWLSGLPAVLAKLDDKHILKQFRGIPGTSTKDTLMKMAQMYEEQRFNQEHMLGLY